MDDREIRIDELRGKKLKNPYDYKNLITNKISRNERFLFLVDAYNFIKDDKDDDRLYFDLWKLADRYDLLFCFLGYFGFVYVSDKKDWICIKDKDELKQFLIHRDKF